MSIQSAYIMLVSVATKITSRVTIGFCEYYARIAGESAWRKVSELVAKCLVTTHTMRGNE